MKQRKTVRVAGPFAVEALIETYRFDKVLGYNIRPNPADPPLLQAPSTTHVGDDVDYVGHAPSTPRGRPGGQGSEPLVDLLPEQHRRLVEKLSAGLGHDEISLETCRPHA